MNFTEFRLLISYEWGLITLAAILLYMFILRWRSRGGLLGPIGAVATTILLIMLCWLQWNKYVVGQQILAIAEQNGAGYTMLTREGTILNEPMVIVVNKARYIIDGTLPHQVRHLPWDIIALPK